MNKREKHHKSIVAGNGNAVTVINKDLNFALRNFKRKIKESKILDNFKDNQTFIKPSNKRRTQISKAKYIQQIKDIQNNF